MNGAGSGARSVCLRTDEYQVHDVTTALKRFLRNLDDPLLTQHLSARWTQAAGVSVLCTQSSHLIFATLLISLCSILYASCTSLICVIDRASCLYLVSSMHTLMYEK